MQTVRLIKTGFPDKYIAFDELPERMLKNVTTMPLTGFPRAWKESADSHYYLDYIMNNKDKEKWQEICSFCMRAVDPSFRLMDKIESMAIPAAKDCHTEIEIQPEDVPVIPILFKHQEKIILKDADIKNDSKTEAKPEVKPEAASKVKSKHSDECPNKGIMGRYADPGICGRCDELRQKTV